MTERICETILKIKATEGLTQFYLHDSALLMPNQYGSCSENQLHTGKHYLMVVVVFVVTVGLMNHAFSTNATYNELKPIFLKMSNDESFRYLFSHKYFYFNKSCF